MKKALWKTTALTLTCAFTLTSCHNNDDNDVETIPLPPSAEAFANIRIDATEQHTQHFQFNAEEGNGTFTSEKGVTLILDGSCLTKDGNAVTGQVDVEFVELFDKGNMLVTNKPTMGVMPDGNKALLISGGEFYINATQDGDPLDMNCFIQLQIPTDLTGGDDNDMILWKGNIDEDGNLAWEENKNPNGDGADGELFIGEREGVPGTQYYAFFNGFGWTNVDRFYNDPRPKTTLKVAVPEGYNHENSAVYLSYDGEANALANLDTYLPSEAVFSEHYGQIPIGLEVHVIFATEDGGNWRYAIKAATIEEDGVITFDYFETNIATEAQLTDLINNLP